MDTKKAFNCVPERRLSGRDSCEQPGVGKSWRWFSRRNKLNKSIGFDPPDTGRATSATCSQTPAKLGPASHTNCNMLLSPSINLPSGSLFLSLCVDEAAHRVDASIVSSCPSACRLSQINGKFEVNPSQAEVVAVADICKLSRVVCIRNCRQTTNLLMRAAN